MRVWNFVVRILGSIVSCTFKCLTLKVSNVKTPLQAGVSPQKTELFKHGGDNLYRL